MAFRTLGDRVANTSPREIPFEPHLYAARVAPSASLIGREVGPCAPRSDAPGPALVVMLGRFILLLALLLSVVGFVPTDEARADYEPEYDDSEIVVHLMGTVGIETINERWGTYVLDAFPDADLYLLAPQVPGEIPLLAEQMQADPDIRSAHPNFVQDTPEGIRQLLIIAVGGEYVDFEDQAITERIGLDVAHTITRGAGVTVAILDTGVDPTHEVLVGHLASDGYDFIDNDSEPWEVANGIDDDGDLQIDEGYGHGTMVAGIIALVAPEATILPIRVLDDDARADAFSVCKAIRYAAMHGADVINMSFGIPLELEAVEHQIQFIQNGGIILVAGAGNESRGDAPFFPAADERVLMVTAVDSLDVKADFADWGCAVDLTAPGTGVRSAFPGGQWALGSGCSFATPFVTGEVALILSLAPYASNDVVEDLVEEAVDPIYHLPGNGPFDGKLGSGRIYLPLALEGVTSGAGDPGVAATRAAVRVFPNPSPGAFHFRLPAGSEIGRASIYDAAGRLMRTLVSSGRDVEWDGMDAGGRRAGAGVYYVLIRETASEHRFGVRVVR